MRRLTVTTLTDIPMCIAVGGGALLDVAGFAAATAHRGVRHVRIPTTTLAQADSGVGVKNGINAFGKKNFIGTFAPPTPSSTIFRCWPPCPRKKCAPVMSRRSRWPASATANSFEEMERDVEKLAAFDPTAMKRLIFRCAELHLNHIARGGDPFETGSARPLDFGHWAAHKLEQISDFQIHHGEAVAIGVALDVIYSRQIGLLEATAAERILRLVAPAWIRDLRRTVARERFARELSRFWPALRNFANIWAAN